jgi:hypothetical protein
MDKNKVPNFKWLSSKRIYKKTKSKKKSNIFIMELIISLILAIMIITLLKFIIDLEQ